MIIINDIIKQLELFKPKIKNELVEITLPIILDINNECITLNIKPSLDGFIISDGGYTFERLNETSKYYIEIYSTHNAEIKKDIKFDNEIFYINYNNNTSLTFAINHFCRLLLSLDEFFAKQKR